MEMAQAVGRQPGNPETIALAAHGMSNRRTMQWLGTPRQDQGASAVRQPHLSLLPERWHVLLELLRCAFLLWSWSVTTHSPRHLGANSYAEMRQGWLSLGSPTSGTRFA